jgi:hypothetical protein
MVAWDGIRTRAATLATFSTSQLGFSRGTGDQPAAAIGSGVIVRITLPGVMWPGRQIAIISAAGPEFGSRPKR